MNKDRKKLLNCCKNALEICLGAKEKDRVVIISDKTTEDITEGFLTLFKELNLKYKSFDLDSFGKRPLSTLPSPIAKELSNCSISIFLAKKEPGELNLRFNILNFVKQYKLRHAHMPGINLEMFIEGLNADYRKVSKLQDIILSYIKDGSVIRVTSSSGTDLNVKISEKYKWIKSDGIIRPGIWQNLPSGQVFTTPDRVEGIFVADGSIGEWFSRKYPEIEKYPLKVEIRNSRIVRVESSNRSLASKFLLYIHSNQDGDRIGEFSFGTNIYMKNYTGNALHDENIPGVHIAAGDPLGYITGADWTAKTRVSLIGKNTTVYIDDKEIIRDGNYIEEILDKLE